MKKLQLAMAASVFMTAAVMPAAAQTHRKHHHKLATLAVGVAGYEAAKHSHNKFAHKHRFAAGIASAYAANKMMKAHDKKVDARHGH